MKLTAEDYRRNYALMSDEEFLAIDREELVDLARRSYDAELAHRQLKPPSVDSLHAAEPEEEVEPHEVPAYANDDDLPREPPPMPHGEETVQIAVIAWAGPARQVLKSLHDANIPAILAENAIVDGQYGEGCFGLLVPASYADDARGQVGVYLTWNNQDLVRNWFLKDWTPDGVDLE